MVTRDDVVLMLSNSGETPELAALIAHAKRLNIPLIGVASNPESTLLMAATVALVLPKAEEACPNGLAPTTSTTLTLALGDALAVALMEVRNFKPEHFKQFHPGGKLGKQLLYVRDLMHKNEEALPFVHINASMQDAILEMTQKGFGITGIKDDDGYLFGVITDGDLRRNMEGLLSKKVVDVATRKPKLIQVTALAQEAVKIMEDSSITCLFVVDKGKPVGLLHIHDLLRQKLM
jgi:arabinose-5-phosphate isomerase